jgi:hypothetical protein
MDNIFLAAAIVSVIYFIAKFIEMKYIDKEMKPIKVLFRDVLLVYVSVVVGFFVINQLDPVVQETLNSATSTPIAFTDMPPF